MVMGSEQPIEGQIIQAQPMVAEAAPQAFAGGQAATRNFQVSAPTRDIASQIARCAESARHTLALAWFGHDIPNWNRPCPITVRITDSLGGGATGLAFDGQHPGYPGGMSVEGRLDKLLCDVIPHEVTHAVLAAAFIQPIPRWADEGAAQTSESSQQQDLVERDNYAYLSSSRYMRVASLMSANDYPPDVMALYCEGYSLSAFLIDKRGRPGFVAFLKRGQQSGWDAAVRLYGYANVQALESDWVAECRRRRGRRRPGGQLGIGIGGQQPGPDGAIQVPNPPPAPPDTFQGQGSDPFAQPQPAPPSGEGITPGGVTSPGVNPAGDNVRPLFQRMEQTIADIQSKLEAHGKRQQADGSKIDGVASHLGKVGDLVDGLQKQQGQLAAGLKDATAAATAARADVKTLGDAHAGLLPKINAVQDLAQRAHALAQQTQGIVPLVEKAVADVGQIQPKLAPLVGANLPGKVAALETAVGPLTAAMPWLWPVTGGAGVLGLASLAVGLIARKKATGAQTSVSSLAGALKSAVMPPATPAAPTVPADVLAQVLAPLFKSAPSASAPSAGHATTPGSAAPSQIGPYAAPAPPNPVAPPIPFVAREVIESPVEDAKAVAYRQAISQVAKLNPGVGNVFRQIEEVAAQIHSGLTTKTPTKGQ